MGLNPIAYTYISIDDQKSTLAMNCDGSYFHLRIFEYFLYISINQST
jgi:hypothetical protein